MAAWRRHLGLTQHDVAVAVGVTVSAVSSWESGRPRRHRGKVIAGTVIAPTQEHLEKFVELLGVSMQKFYGKTPRVAA
jgi:transcriptional regulator with XRE-family HTH domain